VEARLALRVMTYNIRHGRGVDGRVDLGRIADVIASYRPDVVALQEVDCGRRRSGDVDQAGALALRLGMEPVFSPCVVDDTGHYGIATLTRLPLLQQRRLELPGHEHGRRWSEPRGALLTRVVWQGGELDVMNTHLSLRPGERIAQAQALAAELCTTTDVVVCGDLNCTPRSAPYQVLRRQLNELGGRASWPARWPVLRLDHVLYRGELRVVDAGVLTSRDARRASDHLPVTAAFQPSTIAEVP